MRAILPLSTALLFTVTLLADQLTRPNPPTQMKDVFPAPDTGPEVKTAMKAAMEVKGWGALPTTPADLMKELGVKLEPCRHITEYSRGNYAYTTTCFLAGSADGNMYIGEDEEYSQFFAKKWNGKRAALRALAHSGSLIIVEQFHTVLVQDDAAFIWFLYTQKDGCKHPRYWRLVRVTKKGDMTWLGDDMQEAGPEPASLKGKCINKEEPGRRRR
ncbi:MAG: hypothetical protein AB2A00_25905 [Myxococcota bacterium]